jgi:hypothetical protein
VGKVVFGVESGAEQAMEFALHLCPGNQASIAPMAAYSIQWPSMAAYGPKSCVTIGACRRCAGGAPRAPRLPEVRGAHRPVLGSRRVGAAGREMEPIGWGKYYFVTANPVVLAMKGLK